MWVATVALVVHLLSGPWMTWLAKPISYSQSSVKYPYFCIHPNPWCLLHVSPCHSVAFFLHSIFARLRFLWKSFINHVGIGRIHWLYTFKLIVILLLTRRVPFCTSLLSDYYFVGWVCTDVFQGRWISWLSSIFFPISTYLLFCQMIINITLAFSIIILRAPFWLSMQFINRLF